MKNKYLFVFFLLAALSLAGYGFTRLSGSGDKREGEELVIVTSFYPMQIAAMNVAGDCEGVRVECLSEPQTGCLHDYQLTPQDMILLSGADVFIVNGGGIESFLDEAAAEYPDLVIIDAGKEIFSESGMQDDAAKGGSPAGGEGPEGEAHHHEENAHAWMSIRHYRQQIGTICQGLVQADPAHREDYERNRDRYLKEIDEVEEKAGEVKALTAGEPVLIFHEAYEYLAEELGMQVEGVLNLDEERQVSAGELAQIVTAIRQQQIRVLLAEEQYGRDTAEAVEQETGCGVYYLDTLVRGEVRGDAWIRGMLQNLEIMKEALGG